jgi:hypothetical protein
MAIVILVWTAFLMSFHESNLSGMLLVGLIPGSIIAVSIALALLAAG